MPRVSKYHCDVMTGGFKKTANSRSKLQETCSSNNLGLMSANMEEMKYRFSEYCEFHSDSTANWIDISFQSAATLEDAGRHITREDLS